MGNIHTPLSRKQVLLMLSSATLAGCGGAGLMRSAARSTLSTPGPATVICPPSACDPGGGGGGGGGTTYSYVASNGYSTSIDKISGVGVTNDPAGNYAGELSSAADPNGGPPILTFTAPNGTSASQQLISPSQVPFDVNYVWNGVTFRFNSSTKVATAAHPDGVQWTCSFDTNGNMVVQDNKGNRNLARASMVSPFNANDGLQCLEAILLGSAIINVVGYILFRIAFAICAGSSGIACAAALAAAFYLYDKVSCLVKQWEEVQCGMQPQPC